MVAKDAYRHVGLGADDVAFLKKIAGDLPILADVCRADLLLYCKTGRTSAITVAQAMPHSVAPLYEEERAGMHVSLSNQPQVVRGLNGNLHPRLVHTVNVRGATVARQVFPVRNAERKILGVMAMDSHWLAYERQRRRSNKFRDALAAFLAMVLRGELRGAESLTSFGEHDGIVSVGADRRIQYMSGVAAGLYRHVGYRDSLVGRRVDELETVDHEMVARVLSEQRCLERQDEQDGRTWIRRALPVSGPEEPFLGILSGWLDARRRLRSRPQGVFVLIRDVTEALQTQRELESKMAMIREVHHRVKNSLQVIASLLRIQARQVRSDEARDALEETVNRILSVAVVHEFLSQNSQGTINLLEVSNRILDQVQRGLIDPSKRIRLTVKGPAIWLPAERATQCALIVNELVQNALEHGIAHRDEGNVEVELVDRGEKVSVIVTDDGGGLPGGFDLTSDSNVGLRIVKSMVERDLRGAFELSSDQGTRAALHFDKSMVGGG